MSTTHEKITMIKSHYITIVSDGGPIGTNSAILKVTGEEGEIDVALRQVWKDHPAPKDVPDELAAYKGIVVTQIVPPSDEYDNHYEDTND